MFARNTLLQTLRNKSFLLLLFIAATIATLAAANSSPQAPPGHTCEAQYDAAQVIIATEVDTDGDQRKLQTKLDNAWRAFWKEKQPTVANGSLDTLGQLLESEATRGVSAESKTLVAEAVAAFRQCINGQVPVGTATLAVTAFNYDETAPDGKGEPAGPGVYLFVDGKHLGSTNDAGQATLTVPAGTVALQAIVPSTAIAEATVEAAEGTTVPLQLVLDDSKEVTSPVQLSVSGMNGNVLSSTFDSFTITLIDNGAPRAAVAVAEVAIEDDLGNTLERLTDEFQVDALGRLQPLDITVVANAVAKYPGRSLVLRVMAEDALGFTLLGTQPLYWGQHTLNVTLVAPPSNPSLPVAGLRVTYQLMGTGLTLISTSDAAGNVSFGPVPLGNASLDSVTTQAGRYYYGQANFFLSRPTLARVTMTHADDIANGAPRFELQSLPSVAGDSASAGSVIDAETAAHRKALHEELSGGDVSALATVNLRVGAGAANQQISGNRTLTVAQGTHRVVLRYLVTTQEYPYYVTRQSVFNDTWSVSVHARQSGQQLFNIARNVNSQLRNAPIWLANGSTGYIEETFDVAAMTTEGPAELLLAATATNVADSLLPTIVDADLSDDPDRLIIKEVTAERLASTDGDHNSYSVPLQAENNMLARWFTLTLDKPEGAQVTRVRTELQHASGTMAGGQLYEEGPGANVQVIDENTLRVRVTFHAGGSVNTVPPPAHAITYKFTVFANLPDGTEVSDDAISSTKRALWRLQAYWRDPARRYGTRDSGGDDWLSARTWDYINQHGALLTRIDDISGEHGRDIGHATHDVGTDIDLYHVYRFAGATSGTDNYNRMRNTLIRVLSLPAEQTADDRAALTGWVAETRPRFAAILSNTDAQALYYSVGSAYTASGITLNRGWAQRLLVDGTVTAAGGQQFDPGLGAWGFPQDRISYNAVHNTHFHIKRPRER